MIGRRGLLAALAVLLVPLGDATAQTARHYDERGRYLGRSEASGGTTRHYNAQGRYTGRSEQRGREVREYDAAGRYRGRVEAPKDRLHPPRLPPR